MSHRLLMETVNIWAVHYRLRGRKREAPCDDVICNSTQLSSCSPQTSESESYSWWLCTYDAVVYMVMLYPLAFQFHLVIKNKTWGFSFSCTTWSMSPFIESCFPWGQPHRAQFLAGFDFCLLILIYVVQGWPFNLEKKNNCLFFEDLKVIQK